MLTDTGFIGVRDFLGLLHLLQNAVNANTIHTISQFGCCVMEAIRYSHCTPAFLLGSVQSKGKGIKG